MIDENQAKKIAEGVLEKSQYNAGPIPFHVHTGQDSPKVSFSNIINSFFCTATTTTGATLVRVFNSIPPPFNPTITGVFLVSNDTTAGNISVYNSGKTVATLVKGTVAGAMVGATSLSNSTHATLVQVSSSSAGNSTVFITFIA